MRGGEGSSTRIETLRIAPMTHEVFRAVEVERDRWIGDRNVDDRPRVGLPDGGEPLSKGRGNRRTVRTEGLEEKAPPNEDRMASTTLVNGPGHDGTRRGPERGHERGHGLRGGRRQIDRRDQPLIGRLGLQRAHRGP